MNPNNQTDWIASGVNKTNQTQRCLISPMSQAATIGLTVGYVIVFLVAMIGNSIIIYVVRSRLSKGVPFNLLIVNLAACDIIYAFAAAPLSIHYIWVQLLWFGGEFGVFLCKFKEFALLVSIATSILTLSVMSVDRYLAIVHVLKRPLSTRKVHYAIIIIWMVSLMLSSGELVKVKSVTNVNGQHLCIQRWSNDKRTSLMINRVEYTIKFVALYILPLITMVIFYYFIIRFLWLREVPGVKSDENEKKIKKQCKKVVLMLVTMVTVFAVGWLPVHVVHYLSFYFSTCNLPLSVLLFMILLAHANCAINPCLYFVFNSSFRAEFRRLLAKCCMLEMPRKMSRITMHGSTKTLPTVSTRPYVDSFSSSPSLIAGKKQKDSSASFGSVVTHQLKRTDDVLCYDTQL